MNNNLTEIIFLLDRSGSMCGLENDTIGGYNAFVKNQAKQGETRITTVLFDDRYEVLHSGADARNVKLSEREYFTRGNTALLDAVGRTVLDVGARLAAADEAARPGQVIFVITTDGQENASHTFTYQKVHEMITHQKEVYNWQFVFMGANIDVQEESAKLGIPAKQAFAYCAAPKEARKMYDRVDELVCEMRAEPAGEG